MANTGSPHAIRARAVRLILSYQGDVPKSYGLRDMLCRPAHDDERGGNGEYRAVNGIMFGKIKLEL